MAKKKKEYEITVINPLKVTMKIEKELEFSLEKVENTVSLLVNGTALIEIGDDGNIEYVSYNVFDVL